MKAVELKMPDDVYRKLENMASHDQQAVDTFVLRKLEDFVHAVEDFAQLERRAQRGSPEKFRAAMARVPSDAPMPGDELPQT